LAVSDRHPEEEQQVDEAGVARRLAEVGMADDVDYRTMLVAYLMSDSHADAPVFRHQALRRRTAQALGRMLEWIDLHGTRRGKPEAEREYWGKVRDAARVEQAALVALLREEPPPAGPRRRALERLRDEFPDDWRTLTGGKRRARMSLRKLAGLDAAHTIRFLQLVREERARDQDEGGAAAG
jgi:hypothetical protein